GGRRGSHQDLRVDEGGGGRSHPRSPRRCDGQGDPRPHEGEADRRHPRRHEPRPRGGAHQGAGRRLVAPRPFVPGRSNLAGRLPRRSAAARARCRGTSLAPVLSTMDVAAILQALLGAGAPTALPGTAGAAGTVEASFAALFAAASGTDRPAAAEAPDDHSAPGADEQVLSLAGAAAAAALVSPPAVPSA